MKLTTKIKNILAKDGWELQDYQELQNNKKAVLIAVKQDGNPPSGGRSCLVEPVCAFFGGEMVPFDPSIS